MICYNIWSLPTYTEVCLHLVLLASWLDLACNPVAWLTWCWRILIRITLCDLSCKMSTSNMNHHWFPPSSLTKPVSSWCHSLLPGPLPLLCIQYNLCVFRSYNLIGWVILLRSTAHTGTLYWQRGLELWKSTPPSDGKLGGAWERDYRLSYDVMSEIGFERILEPDPRTDLYVQLTLSSTPRFCTKRVRYSRTATLTGNASTYALLSPGISLRRLPHTFGFSALTLERSAATVPSLVCGLTNH